MGNDHPLLAPFFETGTGFVLYKGYPPQRGDDVTALLSLASALPEGVRFAPVPPRWNTLTDLRYLLPDLLSHLCVEFMPSGSGVSGSPERAQGPPLPDLHAADEILEPMLRQALVQMNSPSPPESAMDVLRANHPELLEVMRRTIATNPENMQKARAVALDGADRLKQRNMLRETINIPQDVPVLIVGRPELFFGYYPWAANQEKSDLRRLLDDAGYPGRFHFADDLYAEWLAAEPESAPTIRDPRPPPIRDRKTFRVYSLRPDGRRREDVGFVLASRTPHGQIVMVATGSTSLGTFAAVQLLLQNRRGFAEAMDQLKTAEQKVSVDLGFRCRVDAVSARGRFPRPHRADPVAIELLNPEKMVGYSWGRHAHGIVQPILAGNRKAGKLGDPSYLHWAWGNGVGTLTHVEIAARPFTISPKRTIYPSESFGRLIERIVQDLAIDKKNWLRRLLQVPAPHVTEKVPPDYVDAINSDSTFTTFRPILLLGATGTGKQWVAEMIATHWGGRVLGAEVEEHRAAHLQARQNRRPLDLQSVAEQRWLPQLLSDWIDETERDAPTHSSRDIHALSVVETPETLLGSQLFGIVQGAGTGVEAQLSAFIFAGTGVLFLDELLELESSLQTRLLVALQTGKIMPIGSSLRHPYFCRIVAATNRGEEAADLRGLVSRHEVRSDLVARFSRRYEIPRLENRPLEIVPILMDTLLSERGTGKDESLYLRISRPALELLLTYSYPENIRQLQAFAFSLPDHLVQALSAPDTSNDPAVLARTSIMLEHMTIFGVGKDVVDSTLPPSSYVDVGLDPEKEFFEFSFPALFQPPSTQLSTPSELEENEEPDPGDGTATLGSGALALREWLSASADRFRPMQGAAASVRSTSVLTMLLDQNPDFRSGFMVFVRRLLEAHEAMRREDATENRAFGLNEQRMRAILSQVPVAILPLNSLPKELDAELLEWTQSDSVSSVVKQLAAEGGFHESTSGGRRPNLHKGVLTGFLTGRYQRRR